LSILIDKNTKIIIQNITGREGLFHCQQMLAFPSNIVAGVTPGHGGEWVSDGKVPVFDTVKSAMDITGANASVIFVPAQNAFDAILEAIDAKIPLIVCITEGIPVADMMKISRYIRDSGLRLIGPNSPGILSPGETKIGIIPNNIIQPGNVGVISRSGTLTYEVLVALKKAGMGCSTCVGIGGDPVVGTDFVALLELFNQDPHTDRIVLVGEIGGKEEEKAAELISNGYFLKPVVAYIAGKSAPPGKRMGHAGAIIEGGAGYAESKIKALESAGVRIAKSFEMIPELLK
jgi:succinyl-CoA synthetase alpha subunit